jgi:tetratricopeptide (TPR) repeat protein
VNLPGTITQKYPGVYLFEGKLAEISSGKDGLLYWADNQTCRMYFTSEKDFINIEFQSEKSFITDAAGNATGFARKLNGKELPAAVKIVSLDTLTPNEGQLNAFGWHLLENKRFAEAILYLNRGIQLEPADYGAINNLAHCYLFNKEVDRAIKLYQEFIDKRPGDQEAQKKIIKDDFVYFQKTGFDKVVMDKAAAALKL